MSVTLVYFPVRGRAEPIRLALHLAGVPFDEDHVTRETWLARKAALPLGQVPVLVERDEAGERAIPQSQAILRHLGRQHGLYGVGEAGMVRADIAGDTVLDVRMALAPVTGPMVRGKDPAALRVAFTDTLPPLLARLERLVGEGPYFGGATPSWADCAAFDLLDAITTISPTALDASPGLVRFVAAMSTHARLAPYLAARGPSELAPLRRVLETGERL